MELAERQIMAKRAAKELQHGDIVNLGIGIPTLVSRYIPNGKKIILFSENGTINIGPPPSKGKEDPNIPDAGNQPATILPGGSFLNSADAFGIIRGGYCDVTILGALEISQFGDLANWSIPGVFNPGMGGAMDLAQKAKKVIILTSHVDKKGRSKIVKKCTFPLTAKGCVDLIITDMAVIQVTEEKLVLKEIMQDYTVQDVINATDPKLIVDI